MNTHVDQVGGDHYRNQVGFPGHWDVMEQCDVGYLEATATKYLMRWRKKGTARLDLGKAASYVEKAIKCRPSQGARRLVPSNVIDIMCEGAAIHWMDRDLIKALLCSGSHADFVSVLATIREMESTAS